MLSTGSRVRHTPTGEEGEVIMISPFRDRAGHRVFSVRFDRVPSWNLGKGLAAWAAQTSHVREPDLELIEKEHSNG